MTNELPRNCEFLRASDVLRDAIGLNPDRIGKREEMRISNVLQNCGYKRAQRRIGGKNARFGNRWNHAEPPRREGGSTLQTLWQAGRNYWNHWNRLSTRNPIYIYKSIEGKVRKRWFQGGGRRFHSELATFCMLIHAICGLELRYPHPRINRRSSQKNFS